jgi:O-antigen/teichoic acid export membrane protein
MNSKVKAFLRNFSYAATSNLISLLISTLVVLIVPKIIGVEEYGYWQLYIFYTSYIGFLQFGWNDGIYLKFGGSNYQGLNKGLFSTQFWLLLFSQTIIAIIIVIIANVLIIDPNRLFILEMFSVCLIIVGVRAMPLFILQATNRFKSFSKITILDRLLYFSLISSFLLFEIKDFKFMIFGDLIGKSISFLYAIYLCRDIIFHRFVSITITLKEVYNNINVGIKLMFANVASLLIIGVIRFGIERSWNVSTFGKVSLTISITNMMMFFINAVGMILFPVLKRTDEKKLSEIYEAINQLLMSIFLFLLLAYYPLKIILTSWLPDYSDSLRYMALVFPMFVYEGKMALLTNTYLKTLRKEKLMLKINLVSLILSVLITFVTTILLQNLILAIMSITFIVAFRAIFADWYLSKILSISVKKEAIIVLLVTLSFSLVGWMIVNWWISLILYFFAYMIYMTLMRREIIAAVKYAKLIIMRRV